MTGSESPDTREWVQQLFGNTSAETPTQAPPEPQPTAGPVIPGQEKQPTFSQQPSAAHRYVNQMFSAGTIREYL